ncbi:MAG: rod shape-determining protein MreC [Candidatus Omnitrophota bacterium]
MFNSNPRPSYGRKKKWNFVHPKALGIVFIVISLGLMIYYSSGGRGASSLPLAGVTTGPISIMQGGKNILGGWADYIFGGFRAQKELAAVKKELETLRQENLDLRYKLRNHEAYRKALLFQAEEDSFPSIAAIVTGRDDRMARYIIINRGKLDGLDINMPVCVDRAIVGRTIRITEHYAKVQPITDPGSAIGVYVEGTSYEGILRGWVDGKSLVLKDEHLVPAGDEMRKPEPGMAVYTSNTGMVFPAGILAGYISEATLEGLKVVEPAMKFDTVQSVRVVTKTPLKEEMVSLLSSEE